MIWLPMSEAPKDKALVHLRVLKSDGPCELPGKWQRRKAFGGTSRWVRITDRAELFVLPHSFRFAENRPAQHDLFT